MTENEYGQPVGESLGGWRPPEGAPEYRTLVGTTVVLEPLDPSTHSQPLFDALRPSSDAIWTYMGFGPFEDFSELQATLKTIVEDPEWLPYAFVVDGNPVGFASYLRIAPRDGVIEIGSIVYSPELQRTTAATEGIYLLIDHAFREGYRRVEWKCDDLNTPSVRAAERLGFTYEGTFRKATHYKQRNRDTAWYAIVDDDWPQLRQTFERWLRPDNFDEQGQQHRRLEDMR